jgi:hypothetical protein
MTTTVAVANTAPAPVTTGATNRNVIPPPETAPSTTDRNAIPPPETAPRVDPPVANTSAPVPAKTTISARASAVPKPTDTSPPPAETQLTKELRALDVARSALNRGDANACLAELDKHDRAFPTGQLRMDAAILRVEALLARGDSARAKKLASDLLAQQPNGPSAQRLRTIADGP